MTADERERLRHIPKAELHLHLEGSLTPATLWTLAQLHGQPFGLSSLHACQRLYQFHDFGGFIQAIKTASQLLRDPGDYAEAVRSLARQLREQGVVYAEIFLSIGILLWREVAVEPYWEAVEAARSEAERETGVRMRWLFDGVRQFGAGRFEAVVAWAKKLQSSGSVLGVGVGGDETQCPTADFAAGFACAREAGLQATVHAGEIRGPDAIWEALTLLHPDRIGHGLTAIRDPRLVEALAQLQIPLDICSISNFKTGALGVRERHPAHRYYKYGLKVSASTDDPGIFGCTLLDEYAAWNDRGGFSISELEQVAKSSFACSFLPHEDAVSYQQAAISAQSA